MRTWAVLVFCILVFHAVSMWISTMVLKYPRTVPHHSDVVDVIGWVLIIIWGAVVLFK